MSGRFITIEGIDGAGKSTHMAALAQRLQRGGELVVSTREPGGTALAESLRGLLLTAPMDPLSEALLVFAARRDHVQTLIRPALAAGHTVLCDRFTDATLAYQGGGRGFDGQVLMQLAQWVHGDIQPDLTLWFDVPVEIAASRRASARTADRFEAQDAAFFERVRRAYAERCAAEPERIARIDANATPELVWKSIEHALEARGW